MAATTSFAGYEHIHGRVHSLETHPDLKPCPAPSTSSTVHCIAEYTLNILPTTPHAAFHTDFIQMHRVKVQSVNKQRVVRSRQAVRCMASNEAQNRRQVGEALTWYDLRSVHTGQPTKLTP